MTAESVTAVLNSVNERIFNNALTFNYYANEPDSYSDNVWTVEIENLSLIMWLKNEKHFEIRHRAEDLFWWIDHSIVNEIAIVFEGKIYDDGVDGFFLPVANKFDSVDSYLNGKFSGSPELLGQMLKSISKKHINKILKQLKRKKKNAKETT